MASDAGAGARVSLRAWRESDLPALMALRNDVDLQARLLARARGSDEAQVRAWLEERSKGGDREFFVVAGEDDAPIGYLQFTGIDPVDRHADLGICLAPAAQGRGAGTRALGLGIDWLREHRGLRKLGLRVRADNEAAIRCYQRLGFVRCGRLASHAWFGGQWHDVLLMERFLEDAAG